MNPDDFKQAWQKETSLTRLNVDTELLLKELQHEQQSFTTMLFWRDVREIGISLLLIPVWFYLGMIRPMPWTWYLTVPALLWVAGYMFRDRLRQKRKLPGLGEPLRQYVESSLAQVKHQIWLLRNVFWWYLLPFVLSFLAFFAQAAWQERAGGWWTVLAISGVIALVGFVFAVVYGVNQHAVRAGLEPRSRELESLLTSLKDEAPDASG